MSNEWQNKLKVGNSVFVRKPWMDGIHRAGELRKGIITKVFDDYVIVEYECSQRGGLPSREGFGLESLRSGPYAHLEQWTDDRLAEYDQQQVAYANQVVCRLSLFIRM